MDELKKRLLLLLCLVVLVGVPLVIWISQRDTSRQTSSPTPTPRIVIPTGAPISKAQGGKIIIDDIEMNDFRQQPLRTDEFGDVFFVNTEQYEIVYLGPFNQFNITIKQTPFEENRIRAEEDLIRTLDITPEQACPLNVQISMPTYVDPEFTGNIFQLSFCQ